MLNAITTKIEPDVAAASDLDKTCQLAVIHSLPAIVIPAQMLPQALAERIKRRGHFKIIVTIDFPRGEVYGINKMRGLTREAVGADGYEILLTPGKNENENRNEARVLTDLIRTHISDFAEVRFVAHGLTRPEAEAVQMAKVMKDIQAPALFRTDTHHKMQVTKANHKTHTALATKIRAVSNLPIKISGNIDSIRMIAGCLGGLSGAIKFATSFQQLEQIIKDIQKQPDELKDLLAAGV